MSHSSHSQLLLISLIFAITLFTLHFASCAIQITPITSEPVIQEPVLSGMLPPAATDSMQCTSCVIVITILEDFIKSNASLEYIINTASKICPFLDEEIRIVCPLMIRAMTPEVIGAFLERENPLEVCSMMHLCERAKIDKETLAQKIALARKEKLVVKERQRVEIKAKGKDD